MSYCYFLSAFCHPSGRNLFELHICEQNSNIKKQNAIVLVIPRFVHSAGNFSFFTDEGNLECTEGRREGQWGLSVLALSWLSCICSPVHHGFQTHFFICLNRNSIERNANTSQEELLLACIIICQHNKNQVDE